MRKLTHLTKLILLSFCLTACQTLTSSSEWPEDVPARKIFVKAYYQKRNITAVEDNVMDQHLSWIIRFYQGTVLYPNGWNKISTMFLNSISDEQRRLKMQHRVHQLGIDIANEWAQDNAIRNINSSNIATWGSALRTAAERQDHENFISQVESDVKDMVAGKLSSKVINYERYYSDQDYDDF